MEEVGILSFFFDAVLRAPTIGCMLMCMAASLIGSAVVLRKQALIGEVLSHAAYPGIILGIVLAGFLSIEDGDELLLSIVTLSGAFLTSVGGLWAIQTLVKSARVPPDAALCFILSASFGVGLTLASEVQFSHSILYRQAMNYLYGQAATMIDFHIYLYGAFFIVVAIFILIFYKEIQVSSFDPSYAKSLGIQVKLIDAVLLFLTVSAVIIGIRSVGVILMSAMLIAPAVAARQFTNRLSILLFWSVFFGAASGFFGNYFSVKLTEAFAKWHPSSRVILPTGPMIVLSATAICLAALLFAPEKGIIARLLRMGHFKCRCLCENIIKLMWKSGAEQATHLNQITRAVSSSYLLAHSLLCLLRFQRLVIKEGQRSYRLTAEGRIKAARIVRLHRLWEVYLAHYLDVSADRVHRNAEEMEHILTPELEQKLTLLLEDPKEDPHKQPIPLREEVYAS